VRSRPQRVQGERILAFPPPRTKALAVQAPDREDNRNHFCEIAWLKAAACDCRPKGSQSKLHEYHSHVTRMTLRPDVR
jgi:hypothetical protein